MENFNLKKLKRILLIFALIVISIIVIILLISIKKDIIYINPKEQHAKASNATCYFSYGVYPKGGSYEGFSMPNDDEGFPIPYTVSVSDPLNYVAKIKLSTPIKSGYVFAGWKVRTQGIGQLVTEGSSYYMFMMLLI